MRRKKNEVRGNKLGNTALLSYYKYETNKFVRLKTANAIIQNKSLSRLNVFLQVGM